MSEWGKPRIDSAQQSRNPIEDEEEDEHEDCAARGDYDNELRITNLPEANVLLRREHRKAWELTSA